MTDSQNLVDDLFSQLTSIPKENQHGEIFILESQYPDHPESNQTYVAAFHRQHLVIRGRDTEWRVDGNKISAGNNPWEMIKDFRASSGWVFGYIGYDFAIPVEKRDIKNQEFYKAPDLFLMEPTYLFRIENNRIEQLLGEEIDNKLKYIPAKYTVKQSVPGITKEMYVESIKKIQHLIAEGDFYELNFSYPITAKFEGSSYELYRKMREINPVPFGSYIQMENVSVCCSSPERFLRKTGDLIISEPIKGTSARGTNIAEDDRCREELKNEKNEAENLMIVDLVRHDLSTVCTPGSIKVSKLFEIQTFGTVHQLISRVEGRIADHTDPVDVIRACFPMGSMTGAPKVRVMQRTEELENYRRGIYSGAIGYITPDGDFDFNVVIRTAIISGDRLTYPVGGAITGDSDPEEEWNETQVKAKVLKLVQNENNVK